MKRPTSRTLGLAVALLVVGCVHAPMAWSPDGRWLAYVTATSPDRADRLPPGWLFGDGPDAPPKAAAKGRSARYRLWATRPDTGQSVLLEDATGALTSPGWNPDGTAIAFGRVVATEGGRGRFEVVVQESPERRRVLRSEDLDDARGDLDGLPGLAVAWSPDGRQLAVPQLRPKGLAIVRADDGRLVRAIEGGYLPSWSPEGGKLAFYRAGDPEGLYLLDARPGEPRLLLDVSHPMIAPCWARDSRSVWTVRPLPGGAVEAVRVGVEAEGIVQNKALADAVEPAGDAAEAGAGAGFGSFLGASFASDRDGDNLFASVQSEGKPSEIVWHTLHNNAVLKRWNPVDRLVPIGALAPAPVGKWLALRAGVAGIHAPPGLCDAETTRLTPLVPDDATRAEWVTLLVETARAVIRDHYPAPQLKGAEASRPTLLPIPGEVATAADAAFRLHALGKLGRPLCDRPAGAAEADPALKALLDEARLFFDALGEDYDAALADLAALEPSAVGPDQRLRLLGLRAQLLVGKGDFERANRAIAYLQAARHPSSGRVEMTPTGPTLTPNPEPRDAWPAFLAESAQARAKAPAPAPPAARDPFRVNLADPNVNPAPRVLMRRMPPRARRLFPKMILPPPPPAPPPAPPAPDRPAGN